MRMKCGAIQRDSRLLGDKLKKIYFPDFTLHMKNRFRLSIQGKFGLDLSI